MKTSEQTRQWAAGKSIHNDERDECCPDFSCCEPELLASKEEREKFHLAELSGDSSIKDPMLMTFLGRLIQRAGLEPKVHIVGSQGIDDKH